MNLNGSLFRKIIDHVQPILPIFTNASIAIAGSVTFFAETIHMNIPSYL